MEDKKRDLSDLFDQWSQKCIHTKTLKDDHDMDKNLTSHFRELHQEALSYFSSETSSFGIKNDNENTEKDNNNNDDTTSQKLALLISKLTPAFSYSDESCIASGLYVLCGALLGISQAKQKLTPKIRELLGNFLLERCNYETSPDEIKDVAIQCVQALLTSNNSNILDGDGNDNSIKDTSSQQDIQESMAWRLSFGMDAFTYSTSSFTSDEDEINVDGLSQLTRPKRTECIEILQEAMYGYQKDYVALLTLISSSSSSNNKNIQEDLLSSLNETKEKFTKTCALCFHGESDPRVLLQLLKLMYQCQILFQKTNTDIFDAVAPYYPIRFTPPPNNNNPEKTITREDLQDAVMNVLCYFDDDDSHTEILELSCHLFLDRFFPSEEDMDENAELGTSVDKLEALQDLESLLFQHRASPSDKTNYKSGKNEDIAMYSLDEKIIREISEALMTTHTNCIISFSGEEDDRLAYECRNLAFRILQTLESSLNNVKLYEQFLFPILSSFTSRLITSPESMRGKSAGAYLSKISSSGILTLTKIYKKCVNPLLDHLKISSPDIQEADQERMIGSLITLSGLWSAFRDFFMRNSDKSKISVTYNPHPMQFFATEAFEILKDLIEQTTNSSNLYSAAIYALEAFLCSASFDVLLLNSDDSDTISTRSKEKESFVQDVLMLILKSEKTDEDKYQQTRAHLFGSLLGEVSFSCNDDDSTTQNHHHQQPIISTISVWTRKVVLPKLLDSSSYIPKYYDLVSLAQGCKRNQELSDYLIKHISHKLIESISSKEDSEGKALNSASALSNLINHGGVNTLNSWISMSKGEETQEIIGFEILQALCEDSSSTSEDDVMDKLMLPNVKHELNEKISIKIGLASNILGKLLPSYNKLSSYQLIMKVIQYVSPILPPLSMKDNAKLQISLPVLSILLSNYNDTSKEENISGTSMNEEIRKMVPALCEFVLTSESYDEDTNLLQKIKINHNKTPSDSYDLSPKSTRSTAASCLFSILLLHNNNKDIGNSDKDVDLATLSIKECISSYTIDYFREWSESSKENKEVCEKCVNDVLHLLALVGTASLCKVGSTPFKSGDLVVKFLIDMILLSSETKSIDSNLSIPVTNQVIQIPRDKVNIEQLSINAAQAFGSMLNICDHEKKQKNNYMNKFWKQRCVHIALSKLFSSIDDIFSSSSKGRNLAACYIVCSTSLNKIGNKYTKILMDLILYEFKMKVTSSRKKNELDTKQYESLFVNLALMSILKVFHSKASTTDDQEVKDLSMQAISLIPHLVVLLTNFSESEEITMILAIQNISTLIDSFSGYLRTNLTSDYKTIVQSKLLSVLDHPSRNVRQGAVFVRNEWCAKII